nr:inovirus-type Gp2 protein [uncultured Pseudodesulfovibrio sp.]
MHYLTSSNSNNYNGLPVNNGKNGQYFCYTSMLQRFYELLTSMTERHSRVLFVRFDVRFPSGYMPLGRNEEITHLCKRLKENSRSKGRDLGLFWVREQSREKHQHYHCVALIDGNKVQNHRAFLIEVERIWNHITGSTQTGTIDWCERTRNGQPGRNGIMIQRPLRKAQGEELLHQQNDFQSKVNHCFEWASYLCKTNQKDNTPSGVRRFGLSQMK